MTQIPLRGTSEPLFKNLRAVLLAVASPTRDGADGGDTLEGALNEVARHDAAIALTAKGPAITKRTRGAARRYHPAFRWAIDSAEEAREVLIARDLWPSILDEWRGERTRFRGWDHTADGMSDHESPSLSEVVSVAAHGPVLLDAIAAFEKNALRARRLVLHGMRLELSNFRFKLWRNAVVATYPKPWGYGQSIYAMKAALEERRVA